jgi:hypothetical protein
MMNTFKNFTILGLLAAGSIFAQVNSLTQTTTTAAMTKGSRVIQVTSATGMVAATVSTPATQLYVYDFGQLVGEVMNVLGVSGTNITVQRTTSQTVAHVSGAVVLIGNPNLFKKLNPTGSCVTANVEVAPWVNTLTGEQWLCSTVTLTWVPGFNHSSDMVAVTTAVASAAGVILPSGPLFHITGALAITGFTLPVGYTGGPICVIPDGTATTTNAGNIALASTMVVSKEICWIYDVNAAKPFFPSY